MNLGNKIALVTAASRGLGRNAALQLARHGADVIVTYRQGQAEGEAVQAERGRGANCQHFGRSCAVFGARLRGLCLNEGRG